jgi:hypothetical protein
MVGPRARGEKTDRKMEIRRWLVSTVAFFL